MPSYEEVTQRAGSLRSMTGLTEAEFMVLLPHFEQAFVAYMQHRTIDGNPRTSRRYSTYDTCPLPTMADKLLFILTYLKQNPIQEVQGQLFGMGSATQVMLDGKCFFHKALKTKSFCAGSFCNSITCVALPSFWRPA
jgi:hypothetical protein